jgi:hypothetical protein
MVSTHESEYVLPGEGEHRKNFYTTASLCYSMVGVVAGLATCIFPSKELPLVLSASAAANAVAILVVSHLLLTFNFRLLTKVPSGYDCVEEESPATLIPLSIWKRINYRHLIVHVFPAIMTVFVFLSISPIAKMTGMAQRQIVVMSILATLAFFCAWAGVPVKTQDGFLVACHDKINYLYRTPPIKICIAGPLVVVAFLALLCRRWLKGG